MSLAKFPRRCVLCRSTTNNLYSFPKDASRKRIWAEAIGVTIENIHSRDKLCDLHFSSDQYKSKGSKRLKNDASPLSLESSVLKSKVNNEDIPMKKFPRRCVLCRSTTNNLHGFPKDASRKRIWAEAIGVKIENIHSRDKLCDLHFSLDQYKSKGSKHLKNDASPLSLESLVLKSEVNNEDIPMKKRPRRCVLCRSTTNNLHSFPKDAGRKRIWAEAIGVKIENIHSRDKLCDLHFSSDQYQSKGLKRLKNDALPLLLKYAVTEVESSAEQGNEYIGYSEIENDVQNLETDSNDASPTILTYAVTEVESLAEKGNEYNNCSEIENDVLNLQIEDQAFPNHESEEIPHVSTPTSHCAGANSESTPISQAFTPTKRYFRYYGDIKENDVQTPRRAVVALKMGQALVTELRQQLKTARKRNLALENKIKYLEDHLAEAERL